MMRPIPLARATLAKLGRCQRGATAIEYGLMVSLVVIVAMVGIGTLGGGTGQMWDKIRDKVVAVQP